MKVYGVTDRDLDHLEANQTSASRYWAIFWFFIGVVANVFTNLIFQETLSPATKGAMGVTLLVCFFGSLLSHKFATKDDAERQSIIQNLRDQSTYLDPANEEVTKLLEQIRIITSGTITKAKP